MTHVRISKQTKVQILSKVNSGKPIDDMHLAFIGSDSGFAAEVISAAKNSGNAAFVLQLKKHIESQAVDVGPSPARSNAERVTVAHSAKSNRRRGKFVTAREIYDVIKHIRLGPSPSNYRPTGTTFKSFMASKGTPIDDHPNSTGKPIVFLQGGSPGQGKRA